MKKPIKFGKYLLLNRVNVGGMAEVFKAKTFGVEGFERYVAIKRILPSIAEDSKFIEMFIDEAKITVQLQHANICQIETLGKIEDSHFIAMEFIDGKDLKQLFELIKKTKKPMDIGQACYIISQVCSGLDYAHKKKNDKGVLLNIIHRDISPQNIRISYDGEVKIIDFGIAKAKTKSTKTEAGILKGKFAYMSPEQVSGKTIDRRSDIFAVGIVFYELLTGTRLFQGETDFAILEQIRDGVIDPPRKRNPDIPEKLEEILLKTLSPDLSKRYSYAIELHDDLQKFMILNDYFYSRSDLSRWMRDTFSDSLKQEKKKNLEYEKASNNYSFENEDIDLDIDTNLEWEDDELETALFERGTSDVVEEPKPVSNNNLLQEIEFKKKQNKNDLKKLVIILFSIFFVLSLGIVFLLSKVLVEDEIVVNYRIDLKLENKKNKGKYNIILDGKPIAARVNLPYTINEMLPGEHNLELTLEGYDTFKKKIRFPILTTEKIEELKTLQVQKAKKKFGISYDEYNKGLLVIDFETKAKKLDVFSIESSPSASLYINGKLVSESTPYSIKNLSYGDELEISLKKEGYKKFSKKFKIGLDDLSAKKKELNITLEKAKILDFVVELPRKSSIIYVDGREIKGKSANRKIKLYEGKHTFKLVDDLFFPYVKEIYCSTKKPNIVLNAKQKYVNLKFKVTSGSSITYYYKDSKNTLPKGKLDLKAEVEELKKITFQKDGYATQTLNFKWNNKLNQRIRVTLRKKGQKSKPVVTKNRTYGYISVMSLPSVYIKIDGKNIKKSPIVRYKLTTGKHKITFYDKKKKIYTHEWVNITRGEVTPVIKKFK